jgi:F0F1-type ATP synthase membrane subunit c/vacuolar-type H+-ATPase subunit K
METVTGTETKMTTPPARPSLLRRFLLRLLTFLIAAVLIGLLTRHLLAMLSRNPEPAGFVQGMLQGALMPAALPNLLVGDDVKIYAEVNNGVHYKLGYAFGVDVCGALFFGMFFLRLSRWRRGSVKRDA